MDRIRPFFAVLLALLLAGAAFTGSPAAARDLTGRIGQACVLGSQSAMTLEQAKAHSGWVCDSTTADVKHPYLWVRFAPQSLPVGADISLTGDGHALEAVMVGVDLADGTTRTRIYDHQEIVSRWMPQNGYGLPLYSADERPQMLYVRLDNTLSLLTADRLNFARADTLADQKLRTAVTFAFFVGLMLLAGL